MWFQVLQSNINFRKDLFDPQIGPYKVLFTPHQSGLDNKKALETSKSSRTCEK